MDPIYVKHGKYTVVVSEASRRQGIMRFRYMHEAEEWLEKQGFKFDTVDQASPETRHLFFNLYFDRAGCVGCTTEFRVDGKLVEMPDCDQFLDLPDALISPWSEAALKLNPHWMVRPGTEEEEEKKELSGEKPTAASISSSSSSSIRPRTRSTRRKQ